MSWEQYVQKKEAEAKANPRMGYIPLEKMGRGERMNYDRVNKTFKEYSAELADVISDVLPGVEKLISEATLKYYLDHDSKRMLLSSLLNQAVKLQKGLQAIQEDIRSEELNPILDPELEEKRNEWREANPDKIKE